MKLIVKELVLLLTFLLFGAIYAAPRAKADPDPISSAWHVLDGTGTPVNGAWLTIYYSNDPNKAWPWDIFPANNGKSGADAVYIKDHIQGDAYANPIKSGPYASYQGIAFADLHITAPGNYYFYVEIVLPDGTVQQWPIEDSYKPLEDGTTVQLQVSAATPSGYAWPGNGFGNGPTTGFPTWVPPPPVIPEVPFGTIVSFISMFTVLVGFVGVRRFRPKSH